MSPMSPRLRRGGSRSDMILKPTAAISWSPFSCGMPWCGQHMRLSIEDRLTPEFISFLEMDGFILKLREQIYTPILVSSCYGYLGRRPEFCSGTLVYGQSQSFFFLKWWCSGCEFTKHGKPNNHLIKRISHIPPCQLTVHKDNVLWMSFLRQF